MAYGFDFSGLYRERGELSVSRSVLGFVSYEIRENGLQGYAIRVINRIRRRFGFSSQAEAAALFSDIKDNTLAASRINRARNEDDINFEDFPRSSNILGGSDGRDKFVVSGTVELVDSHGDFVRHVPFVVEGNDRMSKQELVNMIGEDVLGFIDKYESELLDPDAGGLHVGRITFRFAGKR